MIFVEKIVHKIDNLYRQNIVKEQYPMLTSLSRKKLQQEGAIGVIYMLHHVSKKNPLLIPTNEDLKVSPHFLEKMILYYQKQGVEFISLDALYELLISGSEAKRPFVVFTIDDGYLDNYTNALPIFEKYNVPFSIFIATDSVDKKAILWWDILEELILTHDEIRTDEGVVYPCKTFQDRWDTFRLLRERILNMDQRNLEKNFRNLFKDYDFDCYEPIRKKGLNWEQVILLSRHPLCTIGGHTISHPALNKLSFEEAKHEIQGGLLRIQDKTQKSVHYFAYPYGTPNEIGDREFQLASNFDIRLAFMAHQGCLTRENINNLTHLPRVYFKER